ncbi:MAG: restriction endonuclease [Sphaerobacteraceae bacterium]|nr:MAG: restriction endonuclease [Sphaerobacteraceae bacterium]
MNDVTLWGMHAGPGGEAHSLFMQHKTVAMGSSKIADLASIPANRDAFKSAFEQAYPDYKPGAIPVHAGQLFRFVHEMKVGDLVAYPSKNDRMINIGRIMSEYVYDHSGSTAYPHRRKVEWLKSVPRTNLTQGALYEIGSAISLFQIRNYTEEYLAALEGQIEISPGTDDITVALVADEIEKTTEDFILKTLSRELKGHPFADFVAHLLNTMGYNTRVSPEGPDGGVDIIAHRDELGFEPPIIKVQVKSVDSSTGNADVASLYGNIAANEHGLFVALGTFTRHAESFARGKGNLRLIDGRDLVRLVLNNYERFDSKYKSVLPLKRVYIPETFANE